MKAGLLVVGGMRDSDEVPFLRFKIVDDVCDRVKQSIWSRLVSEISWTNDHCNCSTRPV